MPKVEVFNERETLNIYTNKVREVEEDLEDGTPYIK